MTRKKSSNDKPNVHRYRRKKLEPEIAAMSVEELDKDENPTVIVNIDQPGAKAAIKKVIVSISVIAGGVAEWIRNAISKHAAVVALAGATVVAYTTTEATTFREPPTRQPPDPIQQTLTLSGSPLPTPTVSATLRKTLPPSAPARTAAPASSAKRPHTRDIRPSRSAPPTPVPVSVTDHRSESAPLPTRQPTPTRERIRQRADLPTPSPRPSPSRRPGPGVRVDVDIPSSTRAPTRRVPLPRVSASVGLPSVVVSTECVKVDPLLDLCLLG